MLNYLLILFGKTFITIIKAFNLGSGSTWPGHIALKVNKDFIKQTVGEKTKIVLIAGTNGKTTTSSLIAHILKMNGQRVLQNNTGANLVSGSASTIIEGIPLFSKKLSCDYLILEVDENALPPILDQLTPDYIICLNLFRDQLDRYGEIDSIVKKWKNAFSKLSDKTTLILNADDPQVSFLGKNVKPKVLYFGLDQSFQSKIEHGADSTYCPNCFTNLDYKSVVFSHLGNFSCPNCGLKRPTPIISSYKYYPLLGTYNKYNTLAAVLLAQQQKISEPEIISSLKTFKPAFGRQEEFKVEEKNVKIFLSKNPTSFNQSLSTINDLNGKDLLIILNDRVPDGLDVSWIWDVDFENLLNKDMKIFISGDRAFDLALRLKYSNPIVKNIDTNPVLVKSISKALALTPHNETLYILPTYSAMLDVRKVLKGRKIL